jgi:NAD(P)-dependent dehydrogenase (short-subunit alcohol dehydrogenase family)
MKTCIMLGSNSDIAKAIKPMLQADGWAMADWARGGLVPAVSWDLAIIAIGCVAPVGMWEATMGAQWEECVQSNLLVPLRLLRMIWPLRRPDAKVCWFGGSNPQTIMDGYSAYNVSKMAVLKAVEQLDHESADCTFFALGPGVTDTKIHRATREAHWRNPRLERADRDGSFTPMEKIYGALKWCLEQPKEVIGGRNICVSDLDRDDRDELAEFLRTDEEWFKLRRTE